MCIYIYIYIYIYAYTYIHISVCGSWSRAFQDRQCKARQADQRASRRARSACPGWMLGGGCPLWVPSRVSVRVPYGVAIRLRSGVAQRAP